MQFSKNIIATELGIFEQKFSESVKSQKPTLDRIMKYIIKRKGKQLRPMFVFLCAKLHGNINESTYRAAALVELLHTATLVHDDVVDESLENHEKRECHHRNERVLDERLEPGPEQEVQFRHDEERNEDRSHQSAHSACNQSERDYCE